MTTEFQDFTGVDFLFFMEDPNYLYHVRKEYNAIELPQRSSEKPDNETGRRGCLPLMHQFLCSKKTEEMYQGASFIENYDAHEGRQKYICVSNPKVEDCERFWELAWNCEVTTIVMTSRKAEEETHQYWSSSKGSEIQCGGFRVKTLKISERPRFTLTVLRLSDSMDRERLIRHYQYIPKRNMDGDDPFVFLSFVCSLNDTYTLFRRKKPIGWKPGAVLVHCSDGRRCSAVYCILDICVTQFKCTGTVSVANTLQKLRRQKYSCLNHIDDYTFCYQAIHEFVTGELDYNERYLDERKSTRIDTLEMY